MQFKELTIADGLEALPIQLLERVERSNKWFEIAQGAYSENTLQAYRADWKVFDAWCVENGREAMPAAPETIISFIDDMIGERAPASIRRYLSTVNKAHKIAGMLSPLQDQLVEVAKRKIGRGLPEQECGTEASRHHNLAGQQRQAASLTRAHLREIKRTLPIKDLINLDGLSVKKARTAKRKNTMFIKRVRDRALIHLAYDSLLRVSELLRVKYEDFEWLEDGAALLSIGKRKDSQEGELASAYITRESVIEIRRWLDLASIEGGPILLGLTKGGNLRRDKKTEVPTVLGRRAVLNIYKYLANEIGLDESLFSCHSTRVGAANDMHDANINMPSIKQAGRWKTDVMPSRYMRKANAKKGAMAQMEARSSWDEEE